MAVDEVPGQPVQLRLRRKLEELVGVEEADLLMDRPPGGWSSLVTKDWLDERLTHERELLDERFRGLDERFRGLDERFDERFRGLDERFRGIDHQFGLFDAKLDGLRHELIGTMHNELRGQTWRLITAFFGAVASLGVAVGLIAAAARL